ncbi:MAG: phage tail protein [Pseudomonadota bacterium]|nr:phage tail protein [Pseudomonadota bacterium]
MIDQNSQFMAILTNVGAAKLANANALGLPWKLTALGVGDANGTDPVPSATQTRLINERRRAPLNQLLIDPVNAAVVIAEQVIPADVGGWWIREVGLYDADGDLVAVSNCAPSFKPVLSQGSGRTQIVRMNFIVSSTGNITLKIDPAVVLATREYVDLSIDAVLPATQQPGSYRQVVINKRGIVVSGTNPTTLAGYGITDSFANSIGADDYNKLNKTGLYMLGGGATPNRPPGFSGSGALHQVIGDYAVTLAWDISRDEIAFQRHEPGGVQAWCKLWNASNLEPGKKADLKSPAFTDTPTAPTAAAGTNNSQLANCAFTWTAINTYATTVSLALAGKADKATTLGGYGISPATPTEVGAGVDNTKPVTAAALAGIDPWAMLPIGVPIPLFNHLAGAAIPSRAKAYRYITLTASDPYNGGALVSESVAGSFPLVSASAVISLEGSPMNGQTIKLINTEERLLRGSMSPGQALQDALQNITGTLGLASVGSASGALSFARAGSGATYDGANAVGSVTLDASLVARTANETRVKSIGVVYFMRIK